MPEHGPRSTKTQNPVKQSVNGFQFGVELAVKRPYTLVENGAKPEEIREWLEWAGSKLLSMRIRSPAPSGMRNFWPDYGEDKNEAYGYTRETVRPAAVAPKEVAVVDEILLLPSLIEDVKTRRIVHKRSLVAPVSGRYVHSYKTIAEHEHIDARLAARIYRAGIAEIAKRITRKRAHAIRQFLDAS